LVPLVNPRKEETVSDTPSGGQNRESLGAFSHEAHVYAGQDELGKEGNRGLWIANQVCELVQIRTFPTGSVVRLHIRRL
jgi:hypothetical protein